MSDRGQTLIYVGDDVYPPKTVDGVAGAFQDGGLLRVPFGLSRQAMPVVAIAEDGDSDIGQVEVRDGDIAQSCLRDVRPTMGIECPGDDALNVGRFVGLMSLQPDVLAGVGASESLGGDCAGRQSEWVSADQTVLDGHIVAPILRPLPASLIAAAPSRTELLRPAWPGDGEGRAAGSADAVHCTGPALGQRHTVTLLGSECPTAQGFSDLRDVLGRFDPMASTVDRALRDEGAAGCTGAGVFGARHELGVHKGLLGRVYHE
jgi:hypothetical protein